ncbi:MAG: hypothetical protein ACHQTE_02855, partial [Candidatus Saccharimonadales bacterium]
MEPYSFSNGFRVHSTIYRSTEGDTQSDICVDPAELVLPAERKALFDQAYADTAVTHRTSVHYGQTSRDVHYVIVGDIDRAQRTSVYMPGWGSSTKTAAGRLQVARLAAFDPTTRWVVPT